MKMKNKNSLNLKSNNIQNIACTNKTSNTELLSQRTQLKKTIKTPEGLKIHRAFN